jgi:hypothetical protein
MTRSWPLPALLVCAALGTACSSSSGGPASAATKVTLASGVSAEYLAVDATNAYAATQTGIVKIPLSGGAPVTLAPIPQDSGPSGLAVAGSRVYWSENAYSTSTTQGIIYAVPVDGGTPSTIATIAGSAGSVATDDTSVYWAASLAGTTCTTSSCEILVEAPLAGGTAVTLSTSAHSPTSFAFDGSSVYWGNGDGFLLKVPKGGGTATVLADYAATSIEGLGLVGSTLYWGASGGDVLETPASGGASKPLEVSVSTMRSAVFTPDGLAWGIASYAGQSETGVVSLTSPGGATSALWSSTSDAPVVLAAHGTTVVFATSSGALIEIAW